jgi:predicted lipid-binding transport protein (Tim44 family)
MKKLSSLFAVLMAVAAIGLAAVSDDVFAKRAGGGRSVGKQSDQVTQRQAAPKEAGAPTASPQAAAPAAGAAAGAAAQPARNRWLGPIAGLAAGLGLAALASHLGMGEQFGSMMMMVLFGLIAVFAIRYFMSRRKAGAQGMQPAYAGASYSPTQMGPEASVQRFTPNEASPAQFAGAGAAGGAGTAQAAVQPTATAPVVLPAGFDAEGFVRQAKMHFIRLQASFDSANVNDLREFTSPEMFAELQMEIQERNGAANKTEVLQLNSEILGVHSNSIEHMASVRFQGMLREQEGAAPVSIDEVWNLTKPLNGQGGWVLAGIQQLT